ncbi:MAG: hypothetical protein K0Q79_3322 [Flavipsychrobacter sp.]|nr:hypothetical protein [Flavipsychrobacter sp.]
MRYLLLFILILLFTIMYFMDAPHFTTGNPTQRLISYFNFLLFFSSIITVSQYFWPGDKNQAAFQMFNMLFAVVFYIVSFTYLVNHKDAYDGYMYLTGFGCIQHFALRWDIFSIMFWFILVSFCINILYLVRYRDGAPVYS